MRASNLLQMISGKQAQPKQTTPAPILDSTPTLSPAPAPPVAVPVQQEQIDEVTMPRQVGTWKASPAKDVNFEMIMKENGEFSWSVTAQGKTESFSGKYTLEDDLLTLVREEDDQKLIGTMSWTEQGGFSFKLKDAPATDPGLNFTR